jgi:hypothetical protein
MTARRIMLNKVPEVTVYFWIIKILCTTVGESFADYINETLGFGLTKTSLLFSAGLIIALVAQFRLNRYVPSIYWLAVVLISVVGALLIDNLTDGHAVPLWISSTVFAVLLATVFSIWYARERTLSIHPIVTTPREAFYWLTVLATFALGTAVGDGRSSSPAGRQASPCFYPSGLSSPSWSPGSWVWARFSRSGWPTSSRDRWAPTSGTTSPLRTRTGASASASALWAPASCSSARSWRSSCT